MDREIAARHPFALVIGADQVLAVARIDRIEPHDVRAVVEGTVLAAGHPVRDAWIGRPDPHPDRPRRITYVELAEEKPYLRVCACGCGATCRSEYLAGHNQRAVRKLIKKHFDGSLAQLIAWVEHHHDPVSAGDSTCIEQMPTRKPDIARPAVTDLTVKGTTANGSSCARVDAQEAVAEPAVPGDQIPTAQQTVRNASEVVPVAGGATTTVRRDAERLTVWAPDAAEVPAIVQAALETLNVMSQTEEILWTVLARSSAAFGESIGSYQRMQTVLHETFGQAVPLCKSRQRTWCVRWVDLLLAALEWLSNHHHPDPLEHLQSGPLIATLRQVLGSEALLAEAAAATSIRPCLPRGAHVACDCPPHRLIKAGCAPSPGITRT
jgi:hypothetical protein